MYIRVRYMLHDGAKFWGDSIVLNYPVPTFREAQDLLLSRGFPLPQDGDRWICPGAIMEIAEVDAQGYTTADHLRPRV